MHKSISESLVQTYSVSQTYHLDAVFASFTLVIRCCLILFTFLCFVRLNNAVFKTALCSRQNHEFYCVFYCVKPDVDFVLM